MSLTPKVRRDVYADVVAGNLTAHRAAVQAGIRRTPSGLDRLHSAWKNATQEDRRRFLLELGFHP